MGIIVKLGQCIRQRKNREEIRVSLEVLTGLPLTHALRTVLPPLSKPVNFLALPHSFGRCRIWLRCCTITFLRPTENVMQLSVMLTMLSESHGCCETTPPHCVNHCVWQDVYYADGGCATWWIGSDDDVFPDNDSPGTCHYMHVSPVQPGCASLSCYALSPHQRAVQPLPLHSFNSSIPEAPEVTVTPSHPQGE